MWVFPFTSLEPWAPGGSGLLKEESKKDLSYASLTNPQTKPARAHLVQSAAGGGGLPVRYGRGDVSVIESGVPGEQDDASVAKHTVEKQLRRAQQQGEMGWAAVRLYL